MDNDELKRYFRKRTNAVIRELSTPPFERTEETFHRLRVEIKKIKALYQLINFADKKFPRKKLLKPFKEVFDNAGKVRNLQVQENIIKNFGLENHFISALNKKQNRAIHKFESSIDKKLSKQIDKSREEAEKFLKSIKESGLERYNMRAISNIQRQIRTSFIERDLHKVRMKFKEFYYNLKLMNSPEGQFIKSLNNLLELIGSWHDYTSVISRLDDLISEGKLDEKQTAHLLTIRKNTLLEKQALLDKINKSRLRLRTVVN